MITVTSRLCTSSSAVLETSIVYITGFLAGVSCMVMMGFLVLLMADPNPIGVISTRRC